MPIKTLALALFSCALCATPALAKESTYILHDPLREEDMARTWAKDARVIALGDRVRTLEDTLAKRSVQSLQKQFGGSTARTMGLFALPIATRRERTIEYDDTEPMGDTRQSAFLRIGDIGGIDLAFTDVDKPPYLLVLYLRRSADFFPAEAAYFAQRVAWEQRQLASLQVALDRGSDPRPLLRRYTGSLQMPPALYATYARVVDGIRVGNEALIKAESLGSIHISHAPKSAKAQAGRNPINVHFGREDFTPHVLALAKEPNDVMLVRTGSTFLRFVCTRSGTWKLVVYGDKPIR